jgi:hypothetical protein
MVGEGWRVRGGGRWRRGEGEGTTTLGYKKKPVVSGITTLP